MKFPKCKAKIRYVKSRPQVTKDADGNEEKYLAVTIKVEVKGKATMLDIFEPGLRDDFFRSEQGKDHILKHPEIGSFSWLREFTESEHTFDGMTFKGVKLNTFTFICREGGILTITYAAHFPIEEDELGPLAALQLEDSVDVAFKTQFDLVDQVKEKESKESKSKSAKGNGTPNIQPLLPTDKLEESAAAKH